MRWLICAAFVLALAPRAYAGDFDTLRGPMPAYNWGGFYAGGQASYSSANMNLSGAMGPEVAFILRNTSIEQDQNISGWTVLGSRHPANTGFGAFVGYNYSWENVIIGAEINYNHVYLSSSSQGSISRNFTDSGNLPTGHHYFYTVTVSGGASATLTDIATFRSRIGWQADRFLPYGFAGLAIGRLSTSSSATVAQEATDFPDSENPPLTPLCNINIPTTTGCNNIVPTQSQSNTATQAFAYGFATGLGADVAILPNFFIRGEYEFIYFAPVNGVQMNIQTARVGAGVKF
ncbi:MAG TPA: outer membrane beta-barrel protein [Xanthobacteraceae bacterium]|jgi:opacity protein-like surface antigen|nr:outer membrane beta-barrel protein [Xanthobacteraceae bacterium]